MLGGEKEQNFGVWGNKEEGSKRREERGAGTGWEVRASLGE